MSDPSDSPLNDALSLISQLFKLSEVLYKIAKQEIDNRDQVERLQRHTSYFHKMLSDKYELGMMPESLLGLLEPLIRWVSPLSFLCDVC